MDVINKSKLLKKHVYLIHSSSQLNLLELKAGDALLKNAFEQGIDNDIFTIETKKLCSLINYTSDNYKHLKKILLSLLKTEIEFNAIDEDFKDPDWHATTLLASVRLKAGVCVYEYSKLLKEQLFKPDYYGLLNIDITKKFKSKYSYLTYNNCIRFQNINSTGFIKLTTFRKLMGLNENEYLIFRDLNKRVLKPSINEINEVTNIVVTPEFKKKDRQVTEIRFSFNLKTKTNNQLIKKDNDLTSQLREIMRNEFGLNNTRVNFLLQNYESSYIFEKIKIVKNSNSFKKGKIEKLAPYLEKFIVDDLQESKTNNTTLTSQSDKVEKINKKAEKEINELKEKYQRYIENCIRKDFIFIDNKIKDEFKVYPRVYPSDQFNYESIINPLDLLNFSIFVRNKHPGLLKKYLDFELFCSALKDGKETL